MKIDGIYLFLVAQPLRFSDKVFKKVYFVVLLILITMKHVYKSIKTTNQELR